MAQKTKTQKERKLINLANQKVAKETSLIEQLTLVAKYNYLGY